MNILTKVTWQAMKKNRTRTLVTILGVILSSALFTAVLTAAVSGLSYLIRGEIYENGDYYVSFPELSDAEAAQLSALPEVSAVSEFQALGFIRSTDTVCVDTGMLLAACNDTFFRNMPVHVLEGRLPETSGEIVIAQDFLAPLAAYGYPNAIGNTLTLNVTTSHTRYEERIAIQEEYASEPRAFTKEYTIVGIVECNGIRGEETLWLGALLTLADGAQGDALWHSLYVKTDPPSAALDLKNANFSLAESVLQQTGTGLGKNLHTSLLSLYGVSSYENLRGMIASLAAVLCAIILVGSVSLIYNAFAISLSERTRQFGLLASVGATRKQLRRSMLVEAGILCAIGIPLGLLVGWCGIAAVLKICSPYIHSLFSYSVNGPVTMRTLVSLPALLAAAAVALLTVLVSVWLPARRAARCAPMDAIRQTGDYAVSEKAARRAGFWDKRSGLPRMLASRYSRVSRKKYRATVVSLTISVVLLISSASLGQAMEDGLSSQFNTESFDLVAWGNLEELEQVRHLEGIEKVAYTRESRQYLTVVTEEMYSREYWENADLYSFHRSKPIRYVMVFYLEDAVFREYLTAQGIDPEPYFDPLCPAALVCNMSGYTTEQDDSGRRTKLAYHGVEILDASVETLPLYPNIPAMSLCPESEYTLEAPTVTEDGEPLMGIRLVEEGNLSENTPHTVYGDPVWYLVRQEEVTAEGTVFGYYLYDQETKTAAQEPAARETWQIPAFRLGARIDDPPFGLSRANTTDQAFQLTFILPLSAAGVDSTGELSVKVTDYTAYANILSALEQMQSVSCRDLLKDELNARGMLTCLDIFSWGFLILMALISAANVFNTISTNLALRRRDFGMLRSVGMRQRELNHMVCWECLGYGCRALAWGLLLGLPASLCIHQIALRAVTEPYKPPYGAVLLAVCSVTFVVFLSILYAMNRLKQDDPMDAIRMENL